MNYPDDNFYCERFHNAKKSDLHSEAVISIRKKHASFISFCNQLQWSDIALPPTGKKENSAVKLLI